MFYSLVPQYTLILLSDCAVSSQAGKTLALLYLRGEKV